MTALLDTFASALSDRYRIDRELGRGGMATVYLAEDAKHHRKVAVKVLHAELSAVLGPERFVKEIELTANLQHPHILPLFDSGAADGLLFYVMPYVEGETLRARLERERQLPVADAVRIASDVADALAYAHRHGVIHRDIKPENILLHDGRPLVADFGIALAVQQSGGQRMTQTGLSLGTPQYMSPEQAMGDRAIDSRTDIYSLGAVAYEMLAGEPPFTGPTAQAIVARVMTEKPRPLSTLRETVQPQVEDAIHTALSKLPADRFADAAQFAAALRAPPTDSAARRASSLTPAPRGRRASPLALTLAALLIALASFLLGGKVLGRAAPPMEFGKATQVTSDPGLEIQVAISPDGKSVAYAGGTASHRRIFVRQVTGGRVTALTDDSSVDEGEPKWSSDGSRILFLARNAVFSAPATGGTPRQEVPSSGGAVITSASWSPDGASVAYVIDDSLFVKRSDSAARRIAHFREPAMCNWSPDGWLIACSAGNALYESLTREIGNLSPSRVVVVRSNDGSIASITDSASLNQSPIWSRDGKWLFFVSDRDGPRDIYAQRINGSVGGVGKLVRLTIGLDAREISLSADGKRLGYSVFSSRSSIWSVALQSGTVADGNHGTLLRSANETIESLSLSPDGRSLLYDSNLAGVMNLYRLSLAGGTPERLTSDGVDAFAPALSPDGKEVAFHTWSGGSRDIFVLPLDGRPRQRVTTLPGQELLAAWAPDGQALAYMGFPPRGGIGLVRRNPDGSWRAPTSRLDSGFYPAWSPDGKQLAFSTGLLGGSLLTIPADSGAPRLLVDSSVASSPRAEQLYWSADGRSIVFKARDERDNATFWSVPAAGGAPHMIAHLTDPLHPSLRTQFALSRDRIYLTIDDRQSDVWVMNVTSP